MSWYTPDNFVLEEMFPPYFFKEQYPVYGKQLWGFLDYRMVWTVQQFRVHYGPIIMNTWHSDKMIAKYGLHQWRGYRDPTSPYVHSKRSPTFGNISQHRLGQAGDLVFLDYNAGTVREDILNNPIAEPFRYITCIEKDVNWLHFDVRNWDKAVNGILVV